LNVSAAAKFLKVSRKTLYNWTRENVGPPRILIGKRYYYTAEMLTQWWEARRLA